MESMSTRFYQLFLAAWRQRYVIMIPLFMLPIIGAVIGLTAPKHYTAHTSMLVQETSKLNPFLEDFAVSAMLKERMAALGTLLHSRHILTSVALDLKLFTAEDSDFTKEQVISEISAGLSLTNAGKDLIRIDYTTGNPEHVKATLEAVSKHFVEQLLAPERSSIKDSASFLGQHLQKRREELDEAENLLAEYKDRNAGELPELYLSNITQLTKLNAQYSKRQAELEGAQRSLGGMNSQLSKTNPVTIRIEEKIISEKSSLALLRSKYTENHSQVQAALRNLKQLEIERKNSLNKNNHSQNLDELWKAAINIEVAGNSKQQPLLISQLESLQKNRNRVNSLTEEIDSLTQMISSLEAKTRDNGSREQDLNRLERDLDVKKKLYNQILERFEMARVTGSLGDFEKEKRIKIIDRPFTPSRPKNFPVILFVLGGVFGGLFFGSGLAIVFELFDNTIRRKDRLEALTDIPVISRIPPLDNR